jgi:ubiquinone/menaquinone biosynthesis C-methylase UbiE
MKKKLPKTINLDVKKGYDEWSKFYDTDKNVIFHVEGDKILKMLEPVKNKKILDACCGTGRYSIKLAKKGAIVTGIDFSKNMLNIAKNKAKKQDLDINFKIGNVLNLPFKNNSFDIVICALALSHVKNLKKALFELNRVLKKNGILIISDLHHSLCGKKFGGGAFYSKGKRYTIKTFIHPYEDYCKLFKFYNLKIEDFIEFKMDKKFKNYFKHKSLFKFLLGKPFYFIIKLKKN